MNNAIIDRDEAIQHVRNLMDVMIRFQMNEFREFTDAEKFLEGLESE